MNIEYLHQNMYIKYIHQINPQISANCNANLKIYSAANMCKNPANYKKHVQGK